MRKTALIVDDSRVALLGLARLLRARGFLVDTAESGPEALDYLRLNPLPSAMFLDHMMPGMDGFAVLAALKSDTRLATIPVVMFTSQEGAGYMDEARASGAVDVLPKPPPPEVLDRMLVALGTRPERGLPANRARPTPVPLVPATLTPTPAPSAGPAVAAPGPAVTPPLRHAWPLWLLCVLFAAAAAWLFDAYRTVERVHERTLAENARLKTELARRTAEAPNPPPQLMPAIAAALQESPLPAEPRRPGEPSRAMLDALAWALNQRAHYDFGGIPLNDERLATLRELVSRLSAAGFRGTVRIETHGAEFCLQRDPYGGHRLPEGEAAFSSCEVVTHPPAEAVRLAQRQSEAFARYLNERARSPVEIAIVSHGTSRPQQRYPDSLRVVTAGEWNAAALMNQRVEISLVPR